MHLASCTVKCCTSALLHHRHIIYSTPMLFVNHNITFCFIKMHLNFIFKFYIDLYYHCNSHTGHIQRNLKVGRYLYIIITIIDTFLNIW